MNDSIKHIGGYFEWEFPYGKNNGLHEGELLLNSCRGALEYLLNRFQNISLIWIPYYTCEVVLEPLHRLNIPYKFYHINSQLEIDTEIVLQENEVLLYTNYYGIKDAYVTQLSFKYGDRLIIDNAQALYCNPLPASHQIYSPRKYIGMPDGGLLVSQLTDATIYLPKSYSYDRCAHLLKRLELGPSDGYAEFKNNDNAISAYSVSQMSEISQKIYHSVDFEHIKQKRRENFIYIHNALRESNLFEIPNVNTFTCPLVYPYLTKNDRLKQELISHHIYVATYWPNVFKWCKTGDIEYELAKYMICIPIDQRYTETDMNVILKLICK